MLKVMGFMKKINFWSQIDIFGYFPQILIKYDRWLRPRATQTYCRDETDLIEQVRDSDIVAKSTFAQTLTPDCCPPFTDFLSSRQSILEMYTSF